MKILVTGSSGWLGRHLIPCLKEAGHDPVGLDPVNSQWTDIIGSVADKSFIQDLFKRLAFDGVIHAGALHKPDIIRYPQQAFIDVNISGTLNLLEEASKRRDMRFVFTSTTSLMISQKIREERTAEAVWLDESAGPLEPRNIYGVTKLAAEGLCRQNHISSGLHTVILRTARFFPEQDDTIRQISGLNLKSNELLNRRATVKDMARAHLAALEQAHKVKFGLYIVSAPTPFSKEHLFRLKENAATVIQELFPQAQSTYHVANWNLPNSISRVYDGTKITRELGFEYETQFEDVLTALNQGEPLPVDHDPEYASPMLGK